MVFVFRMTDERQVGVEDEREVPFFLFGRTAHRLFMTSSVRFQADTVTPRYVVETGPAWETLPSGHPGPSVARSSTISALRGSNGRCKRSLSGPVPPPSLKPATGAWARVEKLLKATSIEPMAAETFPLRARLSPSMKSATGTWARVE